MNITELLKVVFLGIVEGITEWLPISSTGHMILVEEFMSLEVTPAFWQIFLVVIQLGAILAVVVIYFHRLNPFAPSKSPAQKAETWTTWFKVIVGCLPAAILGFLFDDWLEARLMNWQVVAATLIIYGIAFILIENWNQARPAKVTSMTEMTYSKALQIGAFQALSLVPGTSRSGASILGAISLGTSRRVAADFSFFMSIPIMFGASALKLVKAYLDGFRFSGNELTYLIVGMLIAFLVSILTIKFLLRYVQTKDFKPFGWYRIALGFAVILYFLLIN